MTAEIRDFKGRPFARDNIWHPSPQALLTLAIVWGVLLQNDKGVLIVSEKDEKPDWSRKTPRALAPDEKKNERLRPSSLGLDLGPVVELVSTLFNPYPAGEFEVIEVNPPESVARGKVRAFVVQPPDTRTFYRDRAISILPINPLPEVTPGQVGVSFTEVSLETTQGTLSGLVAGLLHILPPREDFSPLFARSAKYYGSISVMSLALQMTLPEHRIEVIRALHDAFVRRSFYIPDSAVGPNLVVVAEALMASLGDLLYLSAQGPESELAAFVREVWQCYGPNGEFTTPRTLVPLEPLDPNLSFAILAPA